MPDIIWEQLLDHATYLCKVERIGSSDRGRLAVKRMADDVFLLDVEVDLAYGAKFGPDVDDVVTWQALSIEAVDSA